MSVAAGKMATLVFKFLHSKQIKWQLKKLKLLPVNIYEMPDTTVYK